MFAFQLRDMRKAAELNLKSGNPAAELYIMREHALYIQCPFYGLDAAPAKPDRWFVPGKEYGSIVKVRLIDLYTALKTAKGIDE